jgi:hypothetical protein
MSGDDHGETAKTECTPKTGWISGETYCLIHGRAAGWPCNAASGDDHEVDVMYVPVCERCGKPAHYDDRDERWHHDE